MKGLCDSMPHLATESFLTKEQQDRLKGTFDDFVVVVRCKDCIYWHESATNHGYGDCGQANGIALKDENWYCADGKRR